MTRLRLILQNLLYFRKANLSILAGVVIGTAVLTGALITGDSVRYSLLRITGDRLGKIRFALHTDDRFFSRELAESLSRDLHTTVVPILSSTAIAINPAVNERINRTGIIGIDSRFNQLWEPSLPAIQGDEAIISRNIASKLDLRPGDEILLKIFKPSLASPNAPFVAEKEMTVAGRFKIKAVAEDHQMGRFSLKNNQIPPLNVFIPLDRMEKVLLPDGGINGLLVPENGISDAAQLNAGVKRNWKSMDAGLVSDGSLIASNRVFISNEVGNAIRKTFPEAEGMLTYLVNDISSGHSTTPYSFVTATTAPIGGKKLSGHEITINSWLAEDLRCLPGDTLLLRYFVMGQGKKLTTSTASFVVKAILPIEDSCFDRKLMPAFPGMTEAGNCRDWETGSPVDLKRIRNKDEQYWQQYRGTPKAFIALATGQQLWENPFGTYTAFRIGGTKGDFKKQEAQLMKEIDPVQNGLTFTDVKADGMHAASGGSDFGTLFLSLSFFIILSALLLITLLFALQTANRVKETGILTSLGFSRDQIRNLMIGEASVIAATGGIIGAFAGIGINHLLLWGLNTRWQGAVMTSSLVEDIRPVTLFIGALSGSAMSLFSLSVTITLSLRKTIRQRITMTSLPATFALSRHHRNRSRILAVVFLLLAMASAPTAFFFGGSAGPLMAMFAGFFLMAAGVAVLDHLLVKVLSEPVRMSKGILPLMKNLALHRNRTMASVILLALGTFSIIITGANYKVDTENPGNYKSGSGGFTHWAETTMPLLSDLNSREGREKEGLSGEPVLDKLHFFLVLQIDGDDASCLNLNQVNQPGLSGINTAFLDSVNAFRFAALDPVADPNHPWRILDTAPAPGVIFAFADQTVITWGLGKQMGDTLIYPDEQGKPLSVVLAGALDHSIFQGNLILSARALKNHYPSSAVPRLFLFRDTTATAAEAARRLEYLLADKGIMITTTSDRLNSFNTVENTYLSVFILLGGLGVILGTLGLGVVMSRNLYDRRQEMALLRVVGLTQKALAGRVAAEQLMILFTGLLLGLVPALVGIFPVLLEPLYQFPWEMVVVILFLILLSGIATMVFPLRSLFRKELTVSLRND